MYAFRTMWLIVVLVTNNGMQLAAQMMTWYEVKYLMKKVLEHQKCYLASLESSLKLLGEIQTSVLYLESQSLL